MIKHKITGWIIVLVMAYPVLCIGGQDESIGKVVALRGAVVAVAEDGQKRDLGMNAQVFARDVIETGIGRVQLMFKDNTLITLGRNTKMALATYAWDPENKKAEMETQIREGSFRIMGGAITRMAPEKFKTTSVSGTIGIRGSMYAGNLRGTRLTVMFHGGKGIYVQNRAGRVNIRRPGFATLVEHADKAPAAPTRMSTSDLMELETLLSSDQAGEGEQNEQSEDGTGVAENSQDQSTDGTQETASASDSESDTSALDSEASSTLVDDSDSFDTAFDSDAGSDTTSVISDTTTDSGQTSLEEDAQTSVENPDVIDHLKALGFTGTQSTSVPTTGLWKYTGTMKSLLDSKDTDDDMTFVVNWDNSRIMVFEKFNAGSSNQGIGFGFGEVASSGEIYNVVVLGSDANSDDSDSVFALDGTQTFGWFYGTSQEAVGLAMEGEDVNIQNQIDTSPWSDTLAGTLSGKTANTFSGIETWSGFFTGVGENMSAPSTNRHVFFNDDKAKFSFVIDKDNGTFQGAMSGYDINMYTQISNMVIGGNTSNSAYLTDSILAATLSGTNVISNGSSTASLKSYGNYMVTAREAALSSYTTWGYWEAAYVDPASSKDYHIHVPGSFWIAGVATPSGVLDTLIGTSFTATYTGKAQGVMFSDTMSLTGLTGGTSNLTIDFAASTSYGKIEFDGGVYLNLEINSLTNQGFSGQIVGGSPSQVSGAFYGPNAEGVGGNFSGTFSGTHYLGIFAGDR
nr:transferrin-binding protein-like solute binding protein [uncultured Desulfobacter sp.]